MQSRTLDGHIELTSEIAGGKPRISGHRITVQDIVIWHIRLGRSVDEIATEYGLSLADIHAALVYYFDHRDTIDRAITEGQSLAETLRQRTPSKLTHHAGLADLKR